MDSLVTFLLPWLRKSVSDRFLLVLYVQFSLYSPTAHPLAHPHNPPSSVNLLKILVGESIKIKREVRKGSAGRGRGEQDINQVNSGEICQLKGF